MSESQSLQSHEPYMRLALELAERGRGAVEPNPMVGCVIVRDEAIVGKGYHEVFGGPHAEVNAIRSVADPSQLRGATMYVTLEPCCHVGKTPPCCDAIIGTGIRRVIVSMADPFPKVDGGGIGQLEGAGIATEVGLLAEQSQALNAPYLKRVRSQRPWVIAKWAMTADGKIATATGESQWITSDESRRDVHRLRSRVDAILTGMGTVVSDDPTLTARNVGGVPRVASRVVMCRKRVPAIDSNLVRSIDQAPLIIAIGPRISEDSCKLLREHGASIWEFDHDDPIKMIDDVLERLSDNGVTNLMLEGGGAILGSFADANQIDEYQIYIGPTVFGGAKSPGPIAGNGAQKMVDAPAMNLVRVDQFGNDVKLTYARKTR